MKPATACSSIGARTPRYGRGEQVLFREHLDQNEYAHAARAWNPQRFNATAWAEQARQGGFRYAVLTTRHHDGFCLWDSQHHPLHHCRPGSLGATLCANMWRPSERPRDCGLACITRWPTGASRPIGTARPKTRRAGKNSANTVHTQVEELLTQLRQDRRHLVRRRLAALGSRLALSRTGGHDAPPAA
jgi:hypothetical protein